MRRRGDLSRRALSLGRVFGEVNIEEAISLVLRLGCRIPLRCFLGLLRRMARALASCLMELCESTKEFVEHESDCRNPNAIAWSSR